MEARNSRRAAVQGTCWCALIGCVLAGLRVGEGLSYPAGEGRLCIVYTNDTADSLAPCGCQAHQAGGLARRATAIRELATQAPLLVIDSGNIASERDRAALVLQAMSRMGYSHVGLGPLDLKLGQDFVRLAAQNHLKVLSSVQEGDNTWAGTIAADVTQMGGVSVGLVSVGPAVAFPEPETVFQKLQPILSRIRGESQVVVLLSQLSHATNQHLVELQADAHLLDLVIGGRDAAALKEPLVIGQTWILPTTDRGAMLGVVEVAFPAEGRPTFAWQRIPLDSSFSPDEGIEAMVSAYYAAEARRLMERSATVAEDPAAQKYAAVEKCAECHRPQYEQWQAQKHAQALETLRKADRLIPECLSCHSEQYRRTELFKPVEGQRDGVTCTTCHGDGVVHSLLGRKQVLTRDGGEALCRQCHEAEHDPQFDYAQAKEAVRHW